jgi:hypothetical protein
MINDYKFGSIIINNQEYRHDVLVSWQEDVSDWTRKESHNISLPDIKKALAKKPDLIVVGTGESGVAQLQEKTRKEILNKGIKLVLDKTPEAIKAFNILKKKDLRVVGLFHLTC